MPVLFISQQIYGYEDLHMLQSRLPMVSILTTHVWSSLLWVFLFVKLLL